MKIQNVADDAFRRYGKVLEGYDFTELLKEMKHTPVPGYIIRRNSLSEISFYLSEIFFYLSEILIYPSEIIFYSSEEKEIN